MRLSDRLWGGVQLPALEHVQAWLDGHAQAVDADIEPDAQPTVVYASDPVSDEELFVSMLNENQRKVWEGPWGPWAGFGDHWECKKIPVRGSLFQWHICLARHKEEPDTLLAILYDGNDRQRCFHAMLGKEPRSAGVNKTHPYVAAIAFLTQLQASEKWILDRAG